MGIKLSELAKNTALVEVTYMGQSMDVEYRPSVMTTKRINQLQAGLEDEAALEFFREVIVSWDIVGSDGKIIPFTMEGLEEVPAPLMNAVVTTIVNDKGDRKGGNPLKKAAPRTKPKSTRS